MLALEGSAKSAPQMAELHTDVGHFSMEISRMGEGSELRHDQQAKGQVKTDDSHPLFSLSGWG